MTFEPLPFERSFRAWMERAGMGWSEEPLPAGEGRGECRGFRLTPAGEPKRVVLAVHGAGNNSFFGWVGLFKELLEAGCVIHTFDLPGHGRASDTLFDLAASRHSLAGAVQRSVEYAGGLPVHAVGVSLGGSLLLHALAEVGAEIGSAAAIVAPLEIRLSLAAILPEIGHGTLRLVWREREHYGLTGLIPSFGPFKRRTYPLRLATNPRPGAFGYVQSLNDDLRSMRLEEGATRVRIPVLLAYGEADRVVPIEQGARLAAALPHSELLRVKGGTHLTTPLAAEVRTGLRAWMKMWE